MSNTRKIRQNSIGLKNRNQKGTEKVMYKILKSKHDIKLNILLLIIFAFTFFLLSVKNSLAATETFYVCNGGNGTQPEAGSCATAFSASNFSNAANWSTSDSDDGKIGPNDDVIVMDDGGNFGALLDIQQGGLSGKPITIKAQDGDTPTLNRTSTISTWTDDGDGTYSKTGQAAFVWYLTEDRHPLAQATDSSLSDGNWYYDDPGEITHYKPTSGVASDHTTEVIIGSCVDISNKSYLTIQGLTFNYCNFAIYENTAGGTSVTNLIINNNTFNTNRGGAFSYGHKWQLK